MTPPAAQTPNTTPHPGPTRARLAVSRAGTMRTRTATMTTMAVATIALSLAASVGCESSPPRDPHTPLSANEGAALLKDIRTDRSRMQNLTPAEKVYLQKTLRK